MEVRTTYTFVFEVDGQAYSFQAIAPSKEEALRVLRNHLAKIILQINEEK